MCYDALLLLFIIIGSSIIMMPYASGERVTSTKGQVCVVEGPGGNLESLSLLSEPLRFVLEPAFLHSVLVRGVNI